MSFLNIGQKFEKVMGKEQELLDAARTGNLSAIEKLLTNKSRKSTVGVAIGQRLTNFLKSVNVNCTDKNGSSALHHAAVNGHRDVVEALLRAEAQPGLVDNQGCTPVHLAAWSGNPEIVLQLLTAGLDQEPGVACPVTPVHVNQQNNSGDTALHCASQYGHVAVVDVLLQKQANPTIRNLEEASPLDLAAQYGHLAVVQRLLISHPELAQRPSCTQSPLHLAAGNGHRDIVAVLLDNDFNIQTMTDTGTALHQAALHGKLDVVKLLLERGINVHIADKKGQTALMLLGMHQTQQKSFTEITQAIKEHIARTELTMPGVYETLASCKSGHGDKPIAAVKPIPPEKPEPLNINPPDKPFPAPRTSPPPLSPNKSAMSAPKQPTVPILLTHPPPTVPTVPSHPPPAVPEKGDNLARSESSSSVRSPTPPPLPPRQSYFVKDEKPASQPIVPSSPDTLTEKSSPSSVTKLAPQKPKKPPRQKKSPAPGRHSPPNIKDNPLESPTQPSRPIVPDSIPNKDSIPSVVNSDSSSTLQHSNSDFNQSQGGDSKTDQSQNLLHSNEAKSPVSPKPELPPKKVHSSVDNSVDPLTGSKKPNYLDFIKRSSSTPLTPTGYPQPPTPDFPPPSPATAMLGIELKIQEMDEPQEGVVSEEMKHEGMKNSEEEIVSDEYDGLEETENKGSEKLEENVVSEVEGPKEVESESFKNLKVNIASEERNGPEETSEEAERPKEVKNEDNKIFEVSIASEKRNGADEIMNRGIKKFEGNNVSEKVEGPEKIENKGPKNFEVNIVSEEAAGPEEIKNDVIRNIYFNADSEQYKGPEKDKNAGIMDLQMNLEVINEQIENTKDKGLEFSMGSEEKVDSESKEGRKSNEVPDVYSIPEVPEIEDSKGTKYVEENNEHVEENSEHESKVKEVKNVISKITFELKGDESVNVAQKSEKKETCIESYDTVIKEVLNVKMEPEIKESEPIDGVKDLERNEELVVTGGEEINSHLDVQQKSETKEMLTSEEKFIETQEEKDQNMKDGHLIIVESDRMEKVDRSGHLDMVTESERIEDSTVKELVV